MEVPRQGRRGGFYVVINVSSMYLCRGGMSRGGQRLDSLLVRRDILVGDLEHVARRQELSREREADEPGVIHEHADVLFNGALVSRIRLLVALVVVKVDEEASHQHDRNDAINVNERPLGLGDVFVTVLNKIGSHDDEAEEDDRAVGGRRAAAIVYAFCAV